jgi:hypothetical protein
VNWLFYGNNNGVHVPDKKKLINTVTSTPANGLLTPIEYTPLASSVHMAIKIALKGTASQSACLE